MFARLGSRVLVGLVTLFWGADAFAEGGSPEADARSETATVTGTHIRGNSAPRTSPIQVLTREDLKLSGLVSIGDILQNLTAHAAGINTNFNSDGDRTTRMNLRGVGTEYTLVLLNGRRFVPGGAGADNAVDLNAIPAAIIERVEVLKDSASATYGSGSVAGVVNIVTHRGFEGVEGVEVGGYAGVSGHGDGTVYDLSLTTGIASREGRLLVSAGVYEQRAVMAGDRSFSKVDKEYDFESGRVEEVGSSATPQGTLSDHSSEDGNDAWQDVKAACDSGFCYLDPEDGWRNFDTTGNSDTGTGDYYNYMPEYYLVTPQQRYNLFLIGDYQLADWARVYVEGLYMHRVSEQRLAPTPLFTTSEYITVSADNAYNPFGRDFIDVRRRMVEGGPRRFEQHIDTFHLVTGFDGELPDVGPITGWWWDFHFDYGRTGGVEKRWGSYVTSRLERALGPADACTGDCVALDLLGGEGTITQEMLDYIGHTGIERGYTDQLQVHASTGANLVELWPGEHLALALGYELRRESGAYTPDPIKATLEPIVIRRVPGVEGAFDVHTGFLEFRAPLLSGLPAAELLELSGAARLSSSDTFGGQFDYQLGVRWQPAAYVAIRGTYATAHRAPGIGELFRGKELSYEHGSDPCRTSDVNDDGTVAPHEGRSVNAVINCHADGLPTKLHDPSGNYIASAGGNRDLDPETAETFTLGLVLEDALFKGLSATVDLWSFDVDEAIHPPPPYVLSLCYDSKPGERRFCDRITRDPDTHKIAAIDHTLGNVGGIEASGLDFAIGYRNRFGFGDLGLRFELSYLIDHNIVQPNGYVRDVKNVYDELSLFPEVRFNAGAVWAHEGWLLGINLRYVNGFKECRRFVGCNTERAAGEEPPGSRDIDSNTMVDLYSSYTFDSPIGRTEIGFGIHNLLDQDPPFISTSRHANSDAAAYDYIGRFFYTRMTHRF